jgi:hypothetical protein
MDLPGRDIQADAVDRRETPVPFDEVLDDDHRAPE